MKMILLTTTVKLKKLLSKSQQKLTKMLKQMMSHVNVQYLKEKQLTAKTAESYTVNVVQRVQLEKVTS